MLPYQPDLVKLHLESEADKISPDMKVTGGEGGEALRKHLNFHRFELCLASKPCTTPCNPIQGSTGKETPCQCVVKVD